MESTNEGSQSPAAIDDLRSSLSAAFASPSLLNASFCFPGLYKPRLDAGGLLNVSWWWIRLDSKVKQ